MANSIESKCLAYVKDVTSEAGYTPIGQSLDRRINGDDLNGICVLAQLM